MIITVTYNINLYDVAVDIIVSNIKRNHEYILLYNFLNSS